MAQTKAPIAHSMGFLRAKYSGTKSRQEIPLTREDGKESFHDAERECGCFRTVVGEIICLEGYWVRASVKVELTKEEKMAIGRPSSPRWELDIVG